MRDIIFRARRKDNGQWIEGNYTHNKRKGEFYAITDFDTNILYHVYRDSLQMRDCEGEFEDV